MPVISHVDLRNVFLMVPAKEPLFLSMILELTGT